MRIEKSPSSRAICVLCGRIIEKNDYRIKQEYDYGRLQSYYCYHIKCYIERNPDEFLTLLEFLSEYLGDKEAVDRIVKCFKIKQLSEKIGRKENEC